MREIFAWKLHSWKKISRLKPPKDALSAQSQSNMRLLSVAFVVSSLMDLPSRAENGISPRLL
jgi:hypothetical protein